MSDLLLPYPLVMSDLADAGLHDVAVDRCSEFVSTLQQQNLRHGAMLEVLAAVAGDEPDVSEYLLRDSDFDPEFATLRQARAIITTARRQGLDSVKLSKLAAAMGHEAEELGVTPPSTDYATVSILLGAARRGLRLTSQIDLVCCGPRALCTLPVELPSGTIYVMNIGRTSASISKSI